MPVQVLVPAKPGVSELYRLRLPGGLEPERSQPYQGDSACLGANHSYSGPQAVATIYHGVRPCQEFVRFGGIPALP